MATYNQLLKDRRWYKKRDRIIKRDSGKCTVCGSRKTLRVHHTYYLKERTEPWDYPEISLLTLCKDCHEKYHREHELTIRESHIKTGKQFKKKKKIIKPKKITSLKELYKIWEPKLKGRKYRLTRYDNAD